MESADGDDIANSARCHPLGKEATVLPPFSSIPPFSKKISPICLHFLMILLHPSQAATYRRRISIFISVLDLHHHHFCGFFTFRISYRDSLGFICSFHFSFCESFSPLFCEGFIYITMAWFFQSFFIFYFSKFAILIWL